MQTLSKEAEQKLIAAIEKAAALVNDGLSPNDAIIKSAAAADIPAGHINLMVHAYNTGRTTKQREQGENTTEKSADFQLADAPAVLDALYPKAVKTSAEIVRQEIVSTDYAVSPAGMLARRVAEQEKAAAAQVALPAKTYVPYPRDEQFAAERAYSVKRAEQLADEERRRIATAAYSKAAAALDGVVEYFRTPGNMSFADAVRQVGLRLGDEGVSVLHKVAEVYPQFKKQAATSNNHFGDNPLYARVQNAVALTEEYVKASADLKKKMAVIGNKKVATFLTGSVLQEPADFSNGVTLKQAAPGPRGGHFPVSAGPALPPNLAATLFGINPPAPPAPPAKPSAKPTSPAAKKPDGKGERSGGNRSGGSGGGGNRGSSGNHEKNLREFFESANRPVNTVGEQIGLAGSASPAGMAKSILGLDRDPSDIKLKMLKDISSPDHELTLKNIRSQATLHDLMLNDDVISGYSPQEVALAFNEVADAAPNVVQSPAVLRAMLRKRLEAGQLADFDAKQLLEMDKLKAERDQTMLSARKLQEELA